jgi:hypothetical protein
MRNASNSHRNRNLNLVVGMLLFLSHRVHRRLLKRLRSCVSFIVDFRSLINLPHLMRFQYEHAEPGIPFLYIVARGLHMPLTSSSSSVIKGWNGARDNQCGNYIRMTSCFQLIIYWDQKAYRRHLSVSDRTRAPSMQARYEQFHIARPTVVNRLDTLADDSSTY